MYSNSLKLLQATVLVWVLLQQVYGWRDSDGSMSCIEKERQALLELKKGLVDNYAILSSWIPDDDKADCCNWYGIECSNLTGHVQKLDLHARDPDQPLRGEISASLMELRYLTFLDFSWNDVQGNPIPEFIGSLTNLQYLDLSHASFRGKIPYQLGKLSSLQFLSLYKNYLEGEIPYQLGNLSNLQQLRVSENHLSGIIPYQLGNLSRLEALYLGPNDDLKIDVQSLANFEWISHLSSLTKLSLDNISNLKNWLQIVGRLSNLDSLSLANCSLSDMDVLLVPPSQLNFSKSLTELGLSNNKFTLSIFPWLFHLNSSITVLDLTKNLLDSPIPDDLGKIMSSLQSLYLTSNQLYGTIPKTISNLSDLHEFDVSGNFLEGEITNLVHFANLTKLTSLSLSQNSFTLKFSNNWLPQFQLETFEVKSCKLGPVFPKWLQTQKDLHFLDMSNSGISDMATLVSFLCTAGEGLNLLDLSNNHLIGQLPDCWNRLKVLRILDLSNNKISGNIPTSMASLLLIRHLILRNNRFTGPFPSLKNCTDLVMLDVGQNELLGSIHPFLGSNLPKLQVFILRDNHFYGSLPLHLCHLTTIQILDLSMNNFSRQIPNCLQKFSTMTQEPGFIRFIDRFWIFVNGHPTIYFAYDFYPTVRWKGKELPFKDNKRLLNLIDLSSNHLSGKIPKQIGNLSKLVSLDLSSNHLSGEIPRELGNLHALEFLDLSTNHMSGTIPSSLSELSWLAVLNLSNNNLSGQIPLGTQLQSFDASSYDGNPYLCGSPLKRLCPDKKGPKAPSTEKQQDDSFFSQGFYISMGLGFVAGFWAIFGSMLIFPCWRHAYFTFLNNLYERIVALMIIKLARCHRLLRR